MIDKTKAERARILLSGVKPLGDLITQLEGFAGGNEDLTSVEIGLSDDDPYEVTEAWEASILLPAVVALNAALHAKIAELDLR